MYPTPNTAETTALRAATVAPGDVIAAHRHLCQPSAHFVQKYRAYAAGDQPQCLSDEQREALKGLLDNEFCDNICHQIVSVDADRIELEGFRVDGDDAALLQFLADFRVKCHLDDVQAQVNYATLRDGNHALGVSWDPKARRPLLFHEPWWDGETGMFVAYGEDGRPAWAVKEWVAPEPKPAYPGVFGLAARFRDYVLGVLGLENIGQDPLYRWRTVYYPDRIERYRQTVAGGGAWERFQHYVSTETGAPVREAWPVPWVKPDGSPLGLPVVHFANAGRGVGLYGHSEMYGGLLGVQDQINDVHWDLTATGRMTGFQTAWLSGVPTQDRDGNPTRVNLNPGAVFILEDAAAHAGVLPAGDASQLISILTAKKQTASYMTSTPLHLITGGVWPSGEALARAEAPLANKAKKQSNRLGPSWATVAHRAVELANARGEAGLNEDLLITPQFADTAMRDQLSQIAIDQQRFNLEQQKKAAGEEPNPAMA